MEPYKQGALDGLCGVYSLVNSAILINKITFDESKELFKDIISYLDRTKNLSRIITEGLNINIIGEVLNQVDKLNFNREMPFCKLPNTDLDTFWIKMQEFLCQPNRAILIALAGKYDHWSVIKSISDKRINFFDSDCIKYILRKHCTTQEPRGERKHRILPTHTYFFSWKS